MTSNGRSIVVTIQHPANVHFFKNAIGEFEERGDEVHVFAREKDIACDLLEMYDIEYELLAGSATSLYELASVQARYEYEILKRVRQRRPDVLLAVSEPAITHASTCFDCRSILFTDTEHATIQNYLAYPFSDIICTPESYWDDLGPNQVRYPGYHQLAYLHPNRFSPTPDVLDRIDADEDDRLVVLRLVSWNAAHDVGQKGLDHVETVVDGLERAGARVLISAEDELPPSLEDRRIDLPVHMILDLLSYADLFIGESGSMAIESAVLGTPTIYVSSLSAGVLEELEERYGLLFSHEQSPSPQQLLEEATAVLDRERSVWETRRQHLLDNTVDTTEFMLEIVDRATAETDAATGPLRKTVDRVIQR
ncbi:DUF354 domain-containing protein [Halomontanus rarus]|uniref:DUF354 domain-containing protein n=1 Tax=Halomontanus rarus TaxID=3034020 RepID=UPI001A99DCCB